MENEQKLQIMPPQAGYYPVDDMPEYIEKIMEMTKPKTRKLRSDLQTGMVCIVTDGEFIGKRVFYIANKTDEKHFAVCTGPASINSVRLFAIDERFLFKTSLIVEISSPSENEINEVQKCEMSICGKKTEESQASSALENKLEKELLQQISKIKHLKSYIQSSFVVPQGDALSLDY